MTTTCACLLLSGSLAAQATFIVDAAGGPGANFTDITPAVAAVPNGSILLVRAGNYSDVLIDNKAVTVLCDAGVLVPWNANPWYLRITNTLPNQTVVVRGLLPQPFINTWRTAQVVSAGGPVILDGAGGVGHRVAVQFSPQVTVRNYVLASNDGFHAAAEVTGAHVTFESCVLHGANGSHTFVPQGRALSLTTPPCSVQMAHCWARGGDGYAYSSSGGTLISPGSPAISMVDGCALRVLGGSAHTLSSGTTPSFGSTEPPIVVYGAGVATARIEPAVQLVPTMTGSAWLTLTRQVMPSVLTFGAPIGGTIYVSRHGPSGVLFALGVSLPGTASAWLGLPDPLWLDPATLVIEAAGVATPAPFALQKQVPNLAALQGATLFWQAADIDGTGLFALSNPSPSTLF